MSSITSVICQGRAPFLEISPQQYLSSIEKIIQRKTLKDKYLKKNFPFQIKLNKELSGNLENKKVITILRNSYELGLVCMSKEKL